MTMAMFARMGAIKGESQDARHKDEIDVLSWAWGVAQSGSVGHAGGGAGAGKATFHDLSFTHHIDKASPLLLKACATGEHLKNATITVRRASRVPQDHLVITMTDVLVTSVFQNAEAEGAVTAESVVLAFAKVDVEYKPQRPDGTLDAGIHFTYDVTKQKVG